MIEILQILASKVIHVVKWEDDNHCAKIMTLLSEKGLLKGTSIEFLGDHQIGLTTREQVEALHEHGLL